jgi:ribosomal protein L21
MAISYNYVPPKNKQKLIADFYLLSLFSQIRLQKENARFNEVKRILMVSMTDNLKVTTNFLRKTITSVLLIEAIKYKKVFTVKLRKFLTILEENIEDQNIPWSYEGYQDAVMKQLGEHGLKPKEILKQLSKIGEFQDLIKKIELLGKKSRSIYRIDLIRNLLDTCLEKGLMEKFPKSTKNWEIFFQIIKVKDLWNLLRYSSIPQRIIGYLVKYKKLDYHDEVFDNVVLKKAEIERLKEYSKDFLIEYFLEHKSKIRQSLLKYKQFQSVMPSVLAAISSDEAISFICYDFVYHNKFTNPSSKLGPFDPFRIYEVENRLEIAFHIDGSRYQEVLRLYLDYSHMPKDIFVELPKDFREALVNFISENEIVLPLEIRVRELETCEVENA